MRFGPVAMWLGAALLTSSCGDDGSSSNKGSSSSTSTTTASTGATTPGGVSGPTTQSETTSDSSTGEMVPPPPALGDQVDRVGRPLVSTMFLDRFEGTVEPNHDDTVDAYNQDGNLASWADDHVEDLRGSLGVYDVLDNAEGTTTLYDISGNCDDDLNCRAYLARLLSQDTLVIDLGGFDPPRYFAMEDDLDMADPTPAAVGGRTLTDDVVDIHYQRFSGDALLVDGVGEPDQSPSLEFPYLAPAN